jgi:MFS family permease
MSVTDDRPATYREVFAVPEFRVLFAGFAITLVGESAMILALTVLIYDATGSSLLAALGFVAGFLPHAVGGTFLLALADRWRPRPVMTGYSVARVALAAVLAFGVLPPLGMIALVFAVGLFTPVHAAARTALLPELLAGDAYVVGRSIFTATVGAMLVVGYAAGGVLIALVGPYGALWLTAATGLVAALLTRFGLADRPARSSLDPASADSKGTVRQTWRVNRALLSDPAIRGLLLAQWLPAILVVGAEGVLVPYAGAIGAGASVGVLFGATAVGMIAGDLVVGRWVGPARRERLTPWLAGLLGLPLLAFLARPGLIAAAGLLAMGTFGFAYQLGLARRFLAAVPERNRGQAFGLASTGLMALQGGAVASAGALAELITPSVVVAIFGAASLAATLLLRRQLVPVDAGHRAG